MNTHELTGLRASDPLAFLAALGVLRVISRSRPECTLAWARRGDWTAVLQAPVDVDLVETLREEADRWRAGHPAVDFARDQPRNIKDLKHPPDAYRELMRSTALDPETSSFIAAFATGVTVDGSGKKSKPTALHFSAGGQVFLKAVHSIIDEVTEEDLRSALTGPWVRRQKVKGLRWHAGSDRNRALLGYDPGKHKPKTAVGASWLAFQALPLFPVAPVGLRKRITTGFTGRGKKEMFHWCVWTDALTVDAVRTLLGQQPHRQPAPSVAQRFVSKVIRSSQGYGNFAAPNVR